MHHYPNNAFFKGQPQLVSFLPTSQYYDSISSGRHQYGAGDTERNCPFYGSMAAKKSYQHYPRTASNASSLTTTTTIIGGGSSPQMSGEDSQSNRRRSHRPRGCRGGRKNRKNLQAKALALLPKDIIQEAIPIMPSEGTAISLTTSNLLQKERFPDMGSWTQQRIWSSEDSDLAHGGSTSGTGLPFFGIPAMRSNKDFKELSERESSGGRTVSSTSSGKGPTIDDMFMLDRKAIRHDHSGYEHATLGYTNAMTRSLTGSAHNIETDGILPPLPENFVMNRKYPIADSAWDEIDSYMVPPPAPVLPSRKEPIVYKNAIVQQKASTRGLHPLDVADTNRGFTATAIAATSSKDDYRNIRIEKQRQGLADGGSLFITSPRSFLTGGRTSSMYKTATAW